MLFTFNRTFLIIQICLTIMSLQQRMYFGLNGVHYPEVMHKSYVVEVLIADLTVQ